MYEIFEKRLLLVKCDFKSVPTTHLLISPLELVCWPIHWSRGVFCLTSSEMCGGCFVNSCWFHDASEFRDWNKVIVCNKNYLTIFLTKNVPWLQKDRLEVYANIHLICIKKRKGAVAWGRASAVIMSAWSCSNTNHPNFALKQSNINLRKHKPKQRSMQM